MSIRSFNKMFGQGCLVAVSGALLLAMAGSFLMRGNGFGGGGNNGPAPEDDATIALIGDYPVKQKAVESAVTNFSQQTADVPSARQEATMYGMALDQAANAGFTLLEAKKQNVPITDADLLKLGQQELDNQLLQIRLQLMQSGKLKPTASDKDFSDLFLKVTGKSLEDTKNSIKSKTEQLLHDPLGRAQMAAQFAGQAVPKQLAARLKPTDDQLKASYVTLSAKRILFDKEKPVTDADKVFEESKAGTSFETLIDRYSSEKGEKGKKASAKTITLTREQLLIPPYDALLKLKPGELSKVIQTIDGPAIYEVTAIKPTVPKDFEKTKDTLRQTYAQSLADAQYQADLTELKRSVAIQWKNAGCQAIYDYGQLQSNTSIKSDERYQKLKSVALAGQAAVQAKADPLSAKVGALAFYVASSDLAAVAKPADKAAAVDLQLAGIQAVTEVAPGPDIDLELADIYADRKDASKFAEALGRAANDNTDISQTGGAMHARILSEFNAHEDLLPPDAKKGIQTTLDAWAKNKADQDAAQAQAEKEQKAQADKDRAEMLKQQKAEAERQKALKTAPPVVRTPSTAGTAPSGNVTPAGNPPVTTGTGPSKP